MKHLYFFGVLLLFTSCQEKISQEDIVLLNGYWEIEKVRLPNGEYKTYSINTTVDYIEVKGDSGFRKKMHPNPDGTFNTSNDAEKFTLTNGPNGFKIHYTTELSEWVETLTSISNNSFSVINEEDITYSYKRFEPVNMQK